MNDLEAYHKLSIIFAILFGFVLGITAMIPFHLIQNMIPTIIFITLWLIFWKKYGIRIIRQIGVKP